MSAIRWMVKNVSAFLLSFVLAITVWASAVLTADPNQEGPFGPVPIELTGQAADLVLTNEIPSQAILTIKAPRSIWDQLKNNPGKVQVWIDLAGLAAGEHDQAVNAKISLSPVRISKIDPAEVHVNLERLTTKNFPVNLQVKGEPPLGYRKGTPQITPAEVTITGPTSAVENVKDVVASLDINGASQTIRTTLPVRVVDANGASVADVVMTPKDVSVLQPISILGGYKNVAVKVKSTGQVANGYRLTNISVTPPTVTVYSTDPQLVNELPGYVETLPVDLSGLNDDTEFNVAINLPNDISLVSEPSVLVQIGVAAIEGSLKLTLPVEAFGLSPTLHSSISPATVDIIVNGPLPVLDGLSQASFRAIVDLTGLAEGVYQLKPVIDLIPEDVHIQTILPETVEVTISLAPTETPTQTATSTPRAGLPAAVIPTSTPRP